MCSKGPQKAPPVNLSLATSGEKVKAEVHFRDSAIDANDNLCSSGCSAGHHVSRWPTV